MKQPIIFIGHGSPMNAIEENIYTESWKELGASLAKPRAILMFSAHWITEGHTSISTATDLDMIYDMYGFPPPLYAVKYPAKGDPILAREIYDSLRNAGINIEKDPTRGLDHGEWSVLCHMFPDADTPVVSISLDYTLLRARYLDIGRALAPLRESGVLIMGSGNIVHNLRAIDWTDLQIFPWASDFDRKVTDNITSRAFANIIDFDSWKETNMAHPSVDHFLPLLPLLGAVNPEDQVSFLTPEITMGSLAMRSVVWE